MPDYDIVDATVPASTPDFDRLSEDPWLGLRECINWFASVHGSEVDLHINMPQSEQLRDVLMAYLRHLGMPLEPVRKAVVESAVPDTAQGPWPTEVARDIHVRILPEWSEQFLIKNAGYGSAHALLGARGCFPDMYRKVHKLKSALWDGQVLEGEQPREILFDLIGHALMLVSLLDREDTERYAAQECAAPVDFMMARGVPVTVRMLPDDWDAIGEDMREAVRQLVDRDQNRGA